MQFMNKALLETTCLPEQKVMNLNEDSKTKMADQIISKLYKSIKRKSNDIDFPEIETSAGDITKMTSYKDLKNSLIFLEGVSKNSSNLELKQLVTDLLQAEQFLLQYKKYFVKGYASNNNILKCCYISVVGMMVQLTAFAISECIVFINTGIMFESKARPSCPGLKRHMGYKCLKELLELSKKNKLDKNFKDCLTLNEATISIAWLGVTLLVLNAIRGMYFMFLTTRIKLSEYFDTIKDYVELNQANVRDPKIKSKQQKWVTRLEKMRDKISIDQQVASSRAEEDIMEENQQNFNDTDMTGQDELGLL